MYVRNLVAASRNDPEMQRIRNEASRSDSRLGQVLMNRDSFIVLETLVQYGKHFTFHKVTQTTWIHKHLLKVAGGVSARDEYARMASCIY
jgi:hypothetical protein